MDDPFDFIGGNTGVTPAKKVESGSLQDMDADVWLHLFETNKEKLSGTPEPRQQAAG